MLRPLAGALGFFAALLLATTNAFAADANSVRGGLDDVTAQAAALAAQAAALEAQTAAIAAQDAVEDLPVCYARGTDALGRAVDAIGGQPFDSTVNLSDPGFLAGLAYYRECFSNDFEFTLLINNGFIITVPDPATRTEDTDAALEWANFVNNAFRGPGYSSTQHHMGSISSSVNGNEGTITSYLIATHAYGPTASLTGVSVVGGTYDDEVVLEDGHWLIKKRVLNITSSVHVPAGL